MIHPTAFVTDATRLGTAWWRLWAESQEVVAYRMLGAIGLAKSTPTELARMIAEKPAAFAEATIAASQEVLRGHRPDQVATAALEALGRRTRANSQRLRRRGT
ncbi:antifreeze protein [Histidinibacterium aquaticum]|uniref:Antifreeze protein n=1 Tax=Histidinibacterium aquaticum TaxID=2613962 RepID=A0A5J5GKK8_9RHOB|nr:antifreeze protein [Histidinibacterium aquaticum]KAA9008193.1 antifreeze protein [Histidinibacterium aquaticum]